MDSIDIFLYIADLLVIAGVIFAVVLPLIKSLDNPGSLLKTGIGVIALVVVFFIAYTMSGDEVAAKYAADPFNLTPGMSKFVGGTLLTTYALFLIAIVGIVVTEINKATK